MDPSVSPSSLLLQQSVVVIRSMFDVFKIFIKITVYSHKSH